jgi:hypothetical protein
MTPLPDQVSVLLRSSPTAAMAALLLISTSHRGLLDWFSRTVAPEPQPEAKPNANGVVRRGRKANGGGRKSPDKDAYLSQRREARDRDDQALVNVMRSNSEGSIADWATTIGKSRTSCVSGLHRLRAAGLAESVEGRWKLTEEPAPREPPAKWTHGLSAAARREHTTA